MTFSRRGQDSRPGPPLRASWSTAIGYLYKCVAVRAGGSAICCGWHRYFDGFSDEEDEHPADAFNPFTNAVPGVGGMNA